ncbi:MAG: LysR family transcriptional regulator [Myxococcales bacterium]|nr:LysR family transcriptional regulator [Myxococcales bacterium]MDP3504892.1 LysR family transcriptional regulator [Myxococcales bacterium]
MTWLNQHHLEYFRQIAREGGLSAAARRLGITHSTLSMQLKQLEASLGSALFDRKGRLLVLTTFGEQVLTYAENIHRLGAELIDFAEGRASPLQRQPFRVSASASLPRTIVMQLIAPLLDSGHWGPVEIRQTDSQTALGDLVSGRIHLALSDDLVVQPGVHSHLLGSSGLSWYAMPGDAARLRREFPKRLAGQRFVLPSQAVPLRRALDRWLVEWARGFQVVAEVDDAAMLRVLGSRGLGVFPVRDALRAEVEDLLRAERLGPIKGVTERYYALTMERTVRDEGVAIIIGAARSRLSTVR